MKKLVILALALVLSACSDPKDIVLGSDPLKQIGEQGDKFRKLPEAERVLLVDYLARHSMATALGGIDAAKPVTGRTVGEVLKDAHAWEKKKEQEAAEQAKKEKEEAALRAKVMAEREATIKQLGEAVTIVVTNKYVRPKDYMEGRLYDVLKLVYAVENKTDRDIRQIKGNLIVFDASGDKVGDLPITFDEKVGARGTIKTDTGSGWKVQRFDNGDIEKIADTNFEGMKTKFEVEAIAYADGKVVRAPDLASMP